VPAPTLLALRADFLPLMHPFFPRPTQLAQNWIAQILRPGDVAIDATLGNGNDALFLARCVGPNGKVHGFDVQAAALCTSTELFEKNQIPQDQYSWHLLSHAEMQQVVTAPVRAVMFNLGYLPGEDRNVITQSKETLLALEAACSLIDRGGIITIVCYPGHAGGDAETAEVIAWADKQGAAWHVVVYEKRATLRKAPILIAMQKKGADT
jgi:hypothetical protein